MILRGFKKPGRHGEIRFGGGVSIVGREEDRLPAGRNKNLELMAKKNLKKWKPDRVRPSVGRFSPGGGEGDEHKEEEEE